MATTIGEKGLEEVNLTIPQGTSLDLTVTHTDDAGHAIDHTTSSVSMAIQAKDGTTIAHLDACCDGTETGVDVRIPANVTATLPLGRMVWDLMVTMASGDVLRLCYGTVTVVDTYALDGD